MLRDGVALTSVQRYFDVMCPLGKTDPHSVSLTEAYAKHRNQKIHNTVSKQTAHFCFFFILFYFIIIFLVFYVPVYWFDPVRYAFLRTGYLKNRLKANLR